MWLGRGVAIGGFTSFFVEGKNSLLAIFFQFLQRTWISYDVAILCLQFVNVTYKHKYLLHKNNCIKSSLQNWSKVIVTT